MSHLLDHELIFIGTGGGRIHSATQHRGTGGIVYSFNGEQAHIDPGPGAIVHFNRMNLDRFKTKWVIVTHNHTDHQNDVPIMIESLHRSLSTPAGILISTNDYIQSLDSYYKSLLIKIYSMHPNKEISLGPHTTLRGTKVEHGKMDGFGLIFHQRETEDNSISYKLGFTSDTEMFEGFGEVYSDLDILIANVLRPGNNTCPRHTCVKEILPELKIAQPKFCIITHFGAMFDSPSTSPNLIKEQMNYMQEILGKKTRIIGAEDGMRIKISNLLN